MIIEWQIYMETTRNGSIVTFKRKPSVPKDYIESQQPLRLIWKVHLRFMN